MHIVLKFTQGNILFSTCKWIRADGTVGTFGSRVLYAVSAWHFHNVTRLSPSSACKANIFFTLLFNWKWASQNKSDACIFLVCHNRLKWCWTFFIETIQVTFNIRPQSTSRRWNCVFMSNSKSWMNWSRQQHSIWYFTPPGVAVWFPESDVTS